ncbi:monovalent cation:H+ antiporter, CPA1 (nhx1) [Nowakowskiella sp. JEL0078]|nr:monovalent cation:H+ antiporter, CPA1 (nhx1) [Nowakowskiella sp. JEL0078]
MINWINVRIYHREPAIPKNHQLMLFWASLRGAIAFALSFEVSGESGPTIRTTTLMVCVITIIVLGGTTNYALVKFKIRTGVGAKDPLNRLALEEDDVETDSSEDEDEDWSDNRPGNARSRHENILIQPHGPWGRYHDSFDDSEYFTQEYDDEETDENSSTAPGGLQRIRQSLSLARINEFLSPREDDTTHWFIGFDDRWLKPMFTRTRYSQSAPRSRESFHNQHRPIRQAANTTTNPSSIATSKPVPNSSTKQSRPSGSQRSFGNPVGSGNIYSETSTTAATPQPTRSMLNKPTPVVRHEDEFGNFRASSWTSTTEVEVSSNRLVEMHGFGDTEVAGKKDIIDLGN